VGVHIGDLHQKGFPSKQPSRHLVTITQDRITTFSNGLLIGGYLYAHLLARYVPLRWQCAVHFLLWAVALSFLPLSVLTGWTYHADRSTVVQALTLFAAGVGVPFLFLSANAPLIQSWYARTDGPSAADPYFLYGASNFGSMLALLAFPLVAEPIFGAKQIGWGWTLGFVALGGFLVLSGMMAHSGAKDSRQPTSPTSATERVDTTPTRADYVRWALLAFVPSSLMLAVTTQISMDVGSVPLVWVIPLALFLLTFVLTFTNRPPFGQRVLNVGFAAGMGCLAFVFLRTGTVMSWTQAGIMILAFFAVALFCHRRLYEARPGGGHLTAFYLTMSVGGALGGLFNSILAPLMFDRLYEGMVSLVVATLLIMLPSGQRMQRTLFRLAAVGGVTIVYAVTMAWFANAGNMLYSDRSFFGTHRVVEIGGLRQYTNGTTLHGAQRVSDLGAAQPTPLTYYHRNGPMAQVLTSERGLAAQTVGIVGLGVGALTCFRQQGQDWHLYEIDKTVDRMARDPRLFTFVSSCAPDAPTHLGDARMVLQDQIDLRFDILVIDAYSSDAVPMHLTTTEAMALYLDRLKPQGILVYHISNRYYSIDLPLGRSAAALGVVARIQKRDVADIDRDDGESSSTVVMIAREAADFGPLNDDVRWEPLFSDQGRLWTDDYANLLSILR
jgi:hypothetical protein